MPGDAVATAAILSPRPIACSALTACGLTLTAAPISPKAGAVSKTSAFMSKVRSACAAASPARPPPTMAILQLDCTPLHPTCREDLSQANATCIERLAHDTFWSGIEGLDAGRSSARTAALRRTRHPRECQYGRKAALDMPAHPAQAVPRRCDDLHHQRHLHWTRAR